MNPIERRVRAAVNPVSTAATRWWCQSAMRHRLTGHGPTAAQRQLIRRGLRDASRTPSAEQPKARAGAIDELLDRDGPSTGRPC
jgi:hypothetical protein